MLCECGLPTHGACEGADDLGMRGRRVQLEILPRPDEYVRFRYVENPRCFDVETSKNFCAELRKAGKTVVNVDFELWGHSHTLRGYRIVSVDGRPIQDVGGWGHNGANDYSGFCPPHRAFAR